MKLLALLCLCFTICASQNLRCSSPSSEDIKPCSCLKDSQNKMLIYCKGLGSLDVLRDAVKGLKNFKLYNFELSDSNIGTLPADIFKDVEIESLSIKFTNLTSLSESLNRPPYLGLESSLEKIEIRDCFIDDTTPLTRISFAHLKKLNVIELEGNIIPTIGNDMFESGPYGLKELYLFDTSTTVLGSHAFSSLMNLRKLSLTGSSIKEISRKVFPDPARYLESIDLSNNKLTSTPDDLFTKMPSLSEIFFDNNDLITINEVTFAPVWTQLKNVFFYGNPMDCNKNIKWIFQYRLPESLRGHCAAPPDLQGKPLLNLTLSDFN